MQTAANLIPGRATAGATADYHRRHGTSAAARALDGALLAPVGLGTYLGEDSDENDALYREAIERALERGLNVIDSAINYRSQRSERMVGAAVAGAVAAGRVRREEVVVATKAGYVPFDGARPRNFRAYVEETYIRPGIMKADEFVSGCHCMAPGYLEDQIERSRQNLGLATIDIYYLHNPETQFDAVDRVEFLRRTREAFATFENAARQGRIGVYGTATWNGYRRPESATEHLSLAALCALAREVGGDDHHFKVIQLPYNLAMPEAFSLKNQMVDGHRVSVLEAARALGIYVMASASLLQGQLTERLPDDLRATLGCETDAQRAIQFVRSTPGIGTALVGMKRAAHVEAAAAVAHAPAIAAEKISALFD
jgi:aryl-alcohol dehydrogenase-like predicted oxidoreductase